ncbi:Histidine kinase-, DNA gyrase B-, and HSP90-like ATPase [Roseateles sp. YR242]|uniref:sensor histidine kinase n=1 Tax=Roseateles sp. YR242 TaxID=1855305 RepID=UPI0008ADE5FB|nr:ATP-binding protein [Roseateles sp. YR242]SEL38455.1 Histidine kinase-, DNA gyrase B-, and HSP90-like ATPase [Roseateles sp. YR242]
MISVPPDAGRKLGAPPPRRQASTCRTPKLTGTRQVAGRWRPMSVSRALSAAEGRERERIATLLHDEVGALIVRARLRLGEWRHATAPASVAEIDEMCSWLSSISHTVRNLTTALAPPDWHGGLPAALAAMAAELGLGLPARGPTVTVDTNGPDFDLSEPLRAVVCRVVRELCLNVLKHAKARRLDITPRVMDGWLCIQVQDDGVGLGAKPDLLGRGGAGLGLAGARAQLRALGGSLHLRWEPGRGTCATVLLPLSDRHVMNPVDPIEIHPRSAP